MVILCLSCKKHKPEEAYSFFGKLRRRSCEECRQYKRDYAKRNREHLLEMRRFRYHIDPERKTAKKNLEYMRSKRSDPKRKRQMMAVHIKRKYGITIEQYDKMLEEQQNKCAICENFFPNTTTRGWDRPCIDHCHQTNKVRGILCGKCNVTLHYIEDFKFWTAARRYLRINESEDKEPLK